MRRQAFFFKIGAFSLINDAVFSGLQSQCDDFEWRLVDVERDIVRSQAWLLARANLESLARYGSRIFSHRQPPRDFFPRLPLVLRAIQEWVRANVDPDQTALIFQTQSLFDARHPGVPHFLYTDHTYLANRRYPEPKPQLPVPDAWRRMERDLYGGTNCNFVSSGFAAESLHDDYGIPESRVEVVHSGTNIAPAGPPEPKNGRVILFVGVDWERKGGPELVAAFREVRRNIPEARLWIVGCSPAVSEPGVEILGRLSTDRVADCYRQADVFCLPSRIDPSASVLAEAASYGLPVVATPVGGNPERVLDGVSGFLCVPGQLAERLGRLLNDSELRREFGEAGRKMASERFTWAAVCGRMTARMRKELDR